MKTKLLIAAALTVALAGCATSSQPRYGYNNGYNNGYGQSSPAPARCYDCGVIERIEQVYGARDNTRTGAVLGGVVGAVAGRELAGDETSSKNKNAGTVAGAVVGAIAGNAIENKVNEETWNITVRMDDGRRLVINRNSLGNDLRVGAYVRIDGNRIVSMR